MFAPLSSCTSAAPSTIIFINYSGYFPCSPLAASLVSDHIPWKCGIWKHEDYHINIHGILTSNVFLVISIHIQSCGSDFLEEFMFIFTFKQPQTYRTVHIPTICPHSPSPLYFSHLYCNHCHSQHDQHLRYGLLHINDLVLKICTRYLKEIY